MKSIELRDICDYLRSSAVCFSKLNLVNHREHRGHRENWQPSTFSVYWYEKKSNEHNELDTNSATRVRFSSYQFVVFSCSSTYRRFIADSVVDSLSNYSISRKKIKSLIEE